MQKLVYGLIVGSLENINSLHGVYANKHFVYEYVLSVVELFFSWFDCRHETMNVKEALTILDHNVTVGREKVEPFHTFNL